MTHTLKRGFGMVEIMIYIAIMAVLASIAGPLYFTYMKNAAKSKTTQQLALLKNEINRYHGDTGRYPRVLDDLMDKPDADDPLYKKWNGPYLDAKELPEDGWHHEFQYEVTPGGARPYELYSFGPEGEDGPEDDRISAW
jgi:general secretion pathway protein G